MFIFFFRNAVKLKIDAMLAGRLRGFAKFKVLGVPDTVRGREDTVKTNLFCVGDRFEKVRSNSRFATRKQDYDLSARLE